MVKYLTIFNYKTATNPLLCFWEHLDFGISNGILPISEEILQMSANTSKFQLKIYISP